MKIYNAKILTLLCTALFFFSVIPQVFAEGETDAAGTDLLGGFKFGVALGLTMDLGNND